LAPRYRQVQEDLERQITRGAIREGESLPSEDALCRLYAVSRITVRKALDGLRAAHFIESRKGSGSYVIHPPRMFRGWLHDVLLGAWDGRLFISDRWALPPSIVKDELRLAEGEQVKIWETVLLDQGRPYVHSEYHLPARSGERVVPARVAPMPARMADLRMAMELISITLLRLRPASRATSATNASMRCVSPASISPTSRNVSRWCSGITSRWTGACGLMSRIATKPLVAATWSPSR
jgi:hypothetical protein